MSGRGMVSLRLEQETLEAIDRIAEGRGQTRSDIVREALAGMVRADANVEFQRWNPVAEAKAKTEKADAGLIRHHIEYRTNADGEQRFDRQWHEVAVDDEWIDVRDLIEAWRSR